eukprot:m.1437264 g.1437264  ORF g.1437264 m.1437264 type:complete len:599 (+) comp25085_c0_seq23:583-2379(+)
MLVPRTHEYCVILVIADSLQQTLLDVENLHTCQVLMEGYMAVFKCKAVVPAQQSPGVGSNLGDTSAHAMRAISLISKLDAALQADAVSKSIRKRVQHGLSLVLCALLDSHSYRNKVEHTLQEMGRLRLSVLSARRYIGPSVIARRLDAIHVFLKRKTWPKDLLTGAAELDKGGVGGVPATCTFCSTEFRSRNALFRHLKGCTAAPRDPDTADVTTATSAQPPTPVNPAKPATTVVAQGSGGSDSGGGGGTAVARGQSAPPVLSAHAVAVWCGDIPAQYATQRRLNEVLYRHKPAGMPMPHVERVVRKGYREKHRKYHAPSTDGTSTGHASRAGGGNGDATDVAQSDTGGRDQHGTRDGTSSAWLGYAFVWLRDAAEADAFVQALNGRPVDGAFVLRLERSDSRRPRSVPGTTTATLPHRLASGEDPPLAEQLVPKAFSVTERAAAVARHGAFVGQGEDAPPEGHRRDLADIVAFYQAHPRREIHVSGGVQVAPPLLSNLKAELERLRWPATRTRPRVASEHYLVLYRGRPNEGFEALASAVCPVHVPVSRCTVTGCQWHILHACPSMHPWDPLQLHEENTTVQCSLDLAVLCTPLLHC